MITLTEKCDEGSFSSKIDHSGYTFIVQPRQMCNISWHSEDDVVVSKCRSGVRTFRSILLDAATALHDLYIDTLGFHHHDIIVQLRYASAKMAQYYNDTIFILRRIDR